MIHENQRPDSTAYIRLHPENMVNLTQAYFVLFGASIIQTYGQPYDFGSDMHYAGTVCVLTIRLWLSAVCVYKLLDNLKW